MERYELTIRYKNEDYDTSYSDDVNELIEYAKQELPSWQVGGEVEEIEIYDFDKEEYVDWRNK